MTQEKEIIEIDINALQDLLAKAIHTIATHEHKLNLLYATSVALAHEVEELRNHKFSLGLN